MANKYFLIPHELYKGLMEHEPDNINLEYEKRQLVGTKKLPKNEAKNIKYNQELNRYLKIRKEHVNKPIKVELSNGLKVLTKRKRAARSPSIPPSIPSSRRTAPSRSVSSRRTSNFNDDWDGWDNDGLGYGAQGDDDDEGSFVTAATNDKTFMQPAFSGFPPITPTTSRRTVTITENDMRDELYNLIFNNPEKFKVTGMGKIKNNNGRPMPDSDVLQSISRIIDPKVNEASPKGTSILKAAILRDPEAKKIYDQAMTIQMAQKYGHSYNPPGKKLKPKKWY